MKIDPTLSMTANAILTLLAKEDRPMTKTQMAKELNVTFQTVSNNLHALIARKLVVEHNRVGNAMQYKLGDPSMSLVHIHWRGEESTIAEIAKSYASGVAPVERLSQFSRIILKVLAEWYRISADAIDDDAPKPITLAQMKEYQSTIARMRSTLKELLATCDSLLENPDLWHPQAIVNELLIKDQEMDLTIARTIAGNISERLN